MSAPYYSDEHVTLWHGDCLDVLRQLPDASVDAVVTDPPYGLSDLRPTAVAAALTAWLSGDRDHVPDARGFMGRRWDAFVPPPAVWDECLRVLKPGGHLLAFAGSRTHDLMALAVRLAGFEVRDSIAWLYGSGFPKSLDVSKAIDKAAGAEREVIQERTMTQGGGTSLQMRMGEVREVRADITAPATPDAADCLDVAMRDETGLPGGYRYGIWGGLTPDERAALDDTRTDLEQVG